MKSRKTKFLIPIVVLLLCGCKVGTYNINSLWKTDNQIKIETLAVAEDYGNATELLMSDPALLQMKDEVTRQAVSSTLDWNYKKISSQADILSSKFETVTVAKPAQWDDVIGWISECSSTIQEYETIPQKDDTVNIKIDNLRAQMDRVSKHYADNANSLISQVCQDKAALEKVPALLGEYRVELTGISDTMSRIPSHNSRLVCFKNVLETFDQQIPKAEKKKIGFAYFRDFTVGVKNQNILEKYRAARVNGIPVDGHELWKKVYLAEAANSGLTINGLGTPEKIPQISGKPSVARGALLIVPTNVVIVDGKTTEKVVHSKFLSHKVSEPNPDYDSAVLNYNAAMNKYNYASGEYQSNQMQQAFAVDPWAKLGSSLAGIAIASALGDARNALQSAQSTLSSTPRMREKAIYDDYTYTVQEVVKRRITAAYLVLNDNGREYFYEFKSTQEKAFSIPLGLHKNDSSLNFKYDSVRDIEAFGNDKLDISLEKLLTDSQPTAFASIRPNPRTEKTLINARTLAKEVDGSAPLSLTDSVVIITSDSNSQGAGFYVADNLILTNAHVVSPGHSVSVKNSANASGLGTVIKTDSMLDLALIKTDLTGKPIRFASSKTRISQGDEVQAVGHPKGFSFSVSRGIVSALREIPNPIAPGKVLRYIQTDAPISPGNSGGPLIRKGVVVGINTFKFVDRQVEGLGFALHHETIQSFLMMN